MSGAGFDELRRIFGDNIREYHTGGIVLYEFTLDQWQPFKPPSVDLSEEGTTEFLARGLENFKWGGRAYEVYCDLLQKLGFEPSTYVHRPMSPSIGVLGLAPSDIENPKSIAILKNLSYKNFEELPGIIRAAGVDPPVDPLSTRALQMLRKATAVEWKMIATSDGQEAYQTLLPVGKAKSAAWAIGDALKDMSFWERHAADQGHVIIPSAAIREDNIAGLQEDVSTYFSQNQKRRL